MSISANPSIRVSPSMPPAVIGTPIRSARASPSEAASMPTIAPISSVSDTRRTLIIRSVPMFPDPMIATFVMPRLLRRSRS